MNVMLLNVPGELQTPDLSARFLRCCEERQLGDVELSFGFVGIHVPPVVAIATRDLEGDYRLAYELLPTWVKSFGSCAALPVVDLRHLVT